MLRIHVLAFEDDVAEIDGSDVELDGDDTKVFGAIGSGVPAAADEAAEAAIEALLDAPPSDVLASLADLKEDLVELAVIQKDLVANTTVAFKKAGTSTRVRTVCFEQSCLHVCMHACLCV